jgi:hypothetical protein
MYDNFFVKLFFSGLAYFAPMASMIHVVLIFIVLDLLTGLYSSYKQKIPIVSLKLRRTVEKFVCYSIAILIGYAFEINFAHWSNLGQIIAGFIASIELLSIYENIRVITGLNLVTKVKQVITDSVTKLFKKDSKDPKEPTV